MRAKEGREGGGRHYYFVLYRIPAHQPERGKPEEYINNHCQYGANASDLMRLAECSGEGGLLRRGARSAEVWRTPHQRWGGLGVGGGLEGGAARSGAPTVSDFTRLGRAGQPAPPPSRPSMCTQADRPFPPFQRGGATARSWEGGAVAAVAPKCPQRSGGPTAGRGGASQRPAGKGISRPSGWRGQAGLRTPR